MSTSLRAALFPTAYGTVNLSALQQGEPFMHGKLRHLETLGGYAIVTYHPADEAGQIDRDTVHFYGYVDGRPTRQAWHSLDAALAACIAYRQQGERHYAAAVFLSLLRAPL